MKRRTFSKTILAASPFIGIPKTTIELPKKRKIIPKKLKKGDTIGLISPGSFISDEGLEKGVKNMEDLGFIVKLSKNIRAKNGFNAGTDEERLADLNAMFSDNSIDGIWCARGGYGCTRLLGSIDYQLIKKNPKALIGYSDITALLIAIYCKTGLIGFHGPVAASDFTNYTKSQVLQMIMQDNSNFEIKPSIENLEHEDPTYHPQTIKSGIAKGELIGGNLSLLAAMAGTDFEPDFKNKIVFIEDIGESPYRIDRMLVQLKQATNIKEAVGIAFGVFSGCEADNLDSSLSLIDTLTHNFKTYNIPIAYGLSFGHISDQCTLPIGIEVIFDSDKKSILFGN